MTHASSEFDADQVGDTQDPVVEECIRDALAPYLEALSPEELTDYRNFLIAFIRTHPVASRLYERLRERSLTSKSGDLAREDAPAEGEALPRANGTFGGEG